MSLKHRVKKLEQKSSTDENPVEEIVVQYIDAKGKVSGTMAKKLIDGVWRKQTKAIKSSN